MGVRPMYDAGKIVPGLVVFVALATSPIWYNAVSGQAAGKPVLEKPANASQCAAPTEYMRADHMELLNAWRYEDVREGLATYRASDGSTRERSLSGDCLACHSDKTQFCDKCHDYAGVKPDCFDCHLTPRSTPQPTVRSTGNAG